MTTKSLGVPSWTIIVGVLFSVLCCTFPAVADVDLTGNTPPPGAVWLDSISIDYLQQGWSSPKPDHSVMAGPIKIGNMTFAHGIGTHAVSFFPINLHGDATRFQSYVGVDAETGTMGSVTFSVIVDGVVKAVTPVLRGGDQPVHLDVDLTGAQRLDLVVGDGGDGITFDHADWAGAAITVLPGGTAPTAIETPSEPARLIIPADDPSPHIHFPRITGATPGRPFLFLIPATGTRPLTYIAKGLPAGLSLDSKTGIISGSLASDGTTVVHLMVKNAFGVDRSTLTIVGGTHKLALTPPMGWNSWNVWAGNVDQGKVQAAADVMSSGGLAEHGYEYVNIDDTWEGNRDSGGNIQSNNKFPNMKSLADYVHATGLKIGIYSSPGPTTCAGYAASYQHEDQDAQSYANWGFDYLKYDWCSYGGVDPNPDLAGFQKPYAVMRSSLDKVNRDIVFSFCQYGMGDVWKWGQQVGGNCWRTTGDINDSWNSLHSIYESQDGHEKYAGPGHWNDPDMLCVGILGWGNTHPSRLKPNEQILHISMWSLLSAPLLIGCDMTRLDPFTRAILTNDEVIAIDQDSLGQPAGKVSTSADGGEVWARPLSDGTRAVGLMNPGLLPLPVTVTWKELNLNGSQTVRDLWLHKNVGTFPDSYSVLVPTHGAVLLKITPAKAG